MSLYFEMQTAIHARMIQAMESGSNMDAYKLHTIWNPTTTERQRVSNDGSKAVFEVNHPALPGTPENYQEFGDDDGRNILDAMVAQRVILRWWYRKPTQREDGSFIQEHSVGHILANDPDYRGEEDV